MILANQGPRLSLCSLSLPIFLLRVSLVLSILFIRASTMISGRMRIIAGLILSPRSSGSLVTNMKKEEIALESNIGVAESTGTTLY
jgi:hypothetical protein